MKTLLAIFLLTITALPVDRPYRHWAIHSVKCYDDGCKELPKVVYDVLTPTEAIKRFQLEHDGADMRCIVRDYYYRGCAEYY